MPILFRGQVLLSDTGDPGPFAFRHVCGSRVGEKTAVLVHLGRHFMHDRRLNQLEILDFLLLLFQLVLRLLPPLEELVLFIFRLLELSFPLLLLFQKLRLELLELVAEDRELLGQGLLFLLLVSLGLSLLIQLIEHCLQLLMHSLIELLER